MEPPALFPFDQETWLAQQYPKLPLHVGRARITGSALISGPFVDMVRKLEECCQQAQKEPSEPEFDASFFVPAMGNAVMILCSDAGATLNRVPIDGLLIASQKRASFAAWEGAGWSCPARRMGPG